MNEITFKIQDLDRLVSAVDKLEEQGADFYDRS